MRIPAPPEGMRGESIDRTKEIPDGLAEARASVIAMLDELERELAPSFLVLGGFSQGAMLSCDVALRTERAARMGASRCCPGR